MLEVRLGSIFNLDAGDAPRTDDGAHHELNVPGDRLLADLIPDAKLVEVEGADHFWWIMPNWRDMADRVIKFTIGGEIK